MVTHVRVTFRVIDSDSAAALIDAINEFGRAPDIDELLARTTDTPSGDPEGAWTIEEETLEETL